MIKQNQAAAICQTAAKTLDETSEEIKTCKGTPVNVPSILELCNIFVNKVAQNRGRDKPNYEISFVIKMIGYTTYNNHQQDNPKRQRTIK